MQHEAGWHHEDIKAALRKKAGSLSELSRGWGYHRGAITRVLKRPLYSIPLERRIAAELETPPHTLWPDRWDPDGTPRSRSSGGNPSRTAPSSHRQNRGRA